MKRWRLYKLTILGLSSVDIILDEPPKKIVGDQVRWTRKEPMACWKSLGPSSGPINFVPTNYELRNQNVVTGETPSCVNLVFDDPFSTTEDQNECLSILTFEIWLAVHFEFYQLYCSVLFSAVLWNVDTLKIFSSLKLEVCLNEVTHLQDLKHTWEK